MNAAEHITRAKQELAAGDHRAAQTHALIAIAEVLLVSATAAVIDDAMKHAIATLTAVLNPEAGQ